MVKFIRIVLMVAGSMFLAMLILGFTSAPFRIWYDMAVKKAGISRPPDYIVVLGGSGMPSETALMRCWYAAKAGNFFSGSKLIIALPGDTTVPTAAILGMRKELILRGISGERIILENSGKNTRAQALNIYQRISKIEPVMPDSGTGMSDVGQRIRNKRILIVSSPEHIYRAVLTFQKAGFRKTEGLPAFEADIEGDIRFKGSGLGGRYWVPDVGGSITLRYQFWTQLQYEILIIREGFALAYYRIQGWV